MEALRKAASLENFFLRVGDIRAVLDQLLAWNKSGPLANRMDFDADPMPIIRSSPIARCPAIAAGAM